MVIGDFAYSSGGWRIDKHIRYLADIRNIGRADIVGFGDAGVLVSRNNGGLNFSPATLALNDFGYNAGGWRLDLISVSLLTSQETDASISLASARVTSSLVVTKAMGLSHQYNPSSTTSASALVAGRSAFIHAS